MSKTLLVDVRTLIQDARTSVAQAVNAGLVLLYWSVGERIRREILGEERAAYGRQVIEALADRLSREFGVGFSRGRLFSMVQFAEQFPDRQIVLTLSGQLGWSHFVELFPLRDDLARQFYAELCRIERWSVRTLRNKIRSMLYERTAISRKSDALITRELAALREEDRLTPDLVFRDPVNLDFLQSADDLEPDEPPMPTVAWDIRREGRAWGDEALARYALRPEKFEMYRGKLFWSDADRLTLLGLLLENVGADAAVRLGDPEVWRAAVRDLGLG